MAGTRPFVSSPSGTGLLIIDATAIVGLDLQDLLQRAGYRVLDPVFTHGEALAVLARVRPAAVLLSSSLGDGRAAAVAEQPRAAGIPFAVMTAQAAAEPLKPCFATAPRLDRPFADDQVIETVQQLLAGCSSAIDAGGTAPDALAPPQRGSPARP